MENSIKKITLTCLVTLTLLLIAATSYSQYIYNLNPDSVFHDSHTNYWTTGQTTLYGYQGNIFMISLLDEFTGKSPRVYTIDHQGHFAEYNMKPDDKNYFLYGFEDETEYYSGTQGNSIAFEYNGDFWHYHNYMKWNTAFVHTDDSYDCFARFPQDVTLPYHTYYDAINGKPAVIKKGAFQLDSTLYFLGVYAQSGDPNYGKWCVQRYDYDKANDKFIFKKNVLVAGISGNMLGGIVPHTDSSGVTRLLINTYLSSNSAVYLGFLSATTPVGGETTFSYAPPIPSPGMLSNCKASVLIGGSVKGGRTIDNMEGMIHSERVTLLGYGNNNTSVINYTEYQYAFNTIYQSGQGSVVLPSSMTPASWSSAYNLVGAVELIPYKFNNVVGDEANGFIQHNWIYYPDNNGKLCGLRFMSDSWKPIPDSTIISDDLNLDAVSDSTYGPEVRSLWSLAGITDGGPPSSINWAVWDSYYVPETRPTELVFEMEGEFSSSITTVTEDKYTEGADLTFKKKHTSFSAGIEFSEAFKHSVTGSHSWTNILSMPFELNESSQDLGFYIYVIPTITRYTYKKFPWYDPGFRYPEPGSKQFRYQTSSTAVIYRPREISEFPFSINTPNAANLDDWKLANRTKMNKYVSLSGIQPVCNPTWSNPEAGQTGTFITVSDTASEYSNTTSYKVDASYVGKKPKVFEYQVSASHDVNYETSTENESKLSKKVEVSLKNMAEKSKGINFNSYIVHTYWFNPEDYAWWYLDSTGTDRPWYIAYSVSGLSASILLRSPAPGEQLKNTGMLFMWDATGLDPAEYSLFISTTQNVTPSHTVYRETAGLNTNYYLSSLPFCEEGKTYYWAVRAMNRDGDIVWSESRPFVYGADLGKRTTDAGLNVIPYPNPGPGTVLHVLVDSKETGSLSLKITALNSLVVYQITLNHAQAGAQTIELTGLSLQPGIYLLETTINDEKVTRKLVINP